MFRVNDDLSIYVTRGDIVSFTVSAEIDGEAFTFPSGSVVRIKVFEKKNCENVVTQKDFAVNADTKTVEITLTEADTRIGEVISKPKDYWYEVELNPFDDPQTIIGYDDDGAKVFKLFPEGKDLEGEILPEDIPIVDDALSMTSTRPVENQAIARMFAVIEDSVKKNEQAITANTVTIKANANSTTAGLNKKLSLSGGTMTGNIAMSGKKVTGLGNPSADGDAVNLAYAKATFAPAGTYYKPQGTKNSDSSVTDLDYVTEMGSYWVQCNGLTNTPFTDTAGKYGFLDVVTVSNTTLQRFTQYSSNGIAAIYERDNVQTGWKEWVRVDALNKQNTITGAVSTLTGSNLNANIVPVSNASGKLVSSKITATELGYLGGATSNIQSQLNTLKENASPSLAKLGITATAAELNKMDGVTASTTELNFVDGVTSNIQTQLNSKVPASRTVNGKALDGNITLSASDVGARANTWLPTLANLGITTTAAEINKLDGVTSNIQTQLNSKVPASRTVNGKALSGNITLSASDVGARANTWLPTLANLGITATAAELNKMDGVTASTVELNYLDGVTSPIQTQLNGMHKYKGTFTENIDAANLNGAYWLHSGNYTGTVPEDMPTYAYLEATAICQKLLYYSNNTITKVYERYYTNSKWYPWRRTDAVSPKMALGVEYLTDEMHNGLPVYAKLISLGQLSSKAGVTNISTGIAVSKNPYFVGLQAFASDGTFARNIENVGSMGCYLWQNGTSWYVNVTTEGDSSAYSGRALIKYVYQ